MRARLLRPLVLLAAAMLLVPIPARAGETGSIEGTITLRRPDGAAMHGNAGAVVYLVGFSADAPKKAAVMRQKDEAFIPRVLPITKGQKVVFPNDDDERHNVFSVSKARRFDLGLTHPGDKPSITFDRTGLVDVYCNIHPQMAATVLVLPNRAFAVTNKAGHFHIDGVPTGSWKLYVWHPLARPERRQVTISADKTAHLDLTLMLTKKVAPHLDKHGRPYRKRPHY